MRHNLTVEQAHAAGYDLLPAQAAPAANKKVKKASWLRTILWMLSMMVLVNVAMAILFYVLYYYKIIH